MERSSSRLLASSSCTVVFGGVGRGMEGSVAKGWEGINPPAPKNGCIPPPRSTEPERLEPRPCFFDPDLYAGVEDDADALGRDRCLWDELLSESAQPELEFSLALSIIQLSTFSVDGSFGFGIGGIDSIILIPLSILELVSECLHFPDFLAGRPLSKSDPVYSFCESYSGKARDLDDG